VRGEHQVPIRDLYQRARLGEARRAVLDPIRLQEAESPSADAYPAVLVADAHDRHQQLRELFARPALRAEKGVDRARVVRQALAKERVLRAPSASGPAFAHLGVRVIAAEN